MNPKPSYAQLAAALKRVTKEKERVEAERDAAVQACREIDRRLQALGAASSFQWIQGNPAPLEALNKAEAGEGYHVSPNQLKLPL